MQISKYNSFGDSRRVAPITAQALRKRYRAGRVKLKDTYGFLIYEVTFETEHN